MKKQWISVKCGLSRDPKHRQVMGESVWVFLHILDMTSWDDGIVHDWKDEAAAEDLGMPVRTLRDYRRKLSENGYIVCVQKQYTQDIVVNNWTNPREYNGKVYNKTQGDTQTELQSDTQGYVQGSTQHVTPTYNSKNQITKGDIFDGMAKYEIHPKEIRDSIALYFRLTPNWEAKYNKQFMEWAVESKVVEEQVKRAADLWRSDKRFNWQVPTLKGIQEHWLELIAIESTGMNPQGLSLS